MLSILSTSSTCSRTRPKFILQPKRPLSLELKLHKTPSLQNRTFQSPVPLISEPQRRLEQNVNFQARQTSTCITTSSESLSNPKLNRKHATWNEHKKIYEQNQAHVQPLNLHRPPQTVSSVVAAIIQRLSGSSMASITAELYS